MSNNLNIWNSRMLHLIDYSIRKSIAVDTKDFCEKIHFDYLNLSKIKKGNLSFQIPQMINACKLTGTSMDYLCGLTNSMIKSSKIKTPIELIEQALITLKNEQK